MNHDDTQPSEPTELAPLTLSLANNRIAVVGGATTSTTVGEVAAALEPETRTARSGRIMIDGRVTVGGQLLLRSGVVRGSRIETAPAHIDATASSERPVMTAVWLRGVDAGGHCHLVPGRHFIGRARTASVRCDDPALELHHAVLDIASDGSMLVSQLAGLHPVLLDGRLITGPTNVAPGQRIDVGDSVLTTREFETNGATNTLRDLAGVRRSGDPWRVPWIRSPRQRSAFEPHVIDAPRPSATPSALHGGLLPAVLGVAGAAALALLFDQLMFLLFGAMGALVAFGTWLAQRVGLLRSRRSAAAADKFALDTFVAALTDQRDACRRALLAGSPTIDRAVAAMLDRTNDLWGVRATDDDAFTVSIGEAEGTWQPVVGGLEDAISNRSGGRSPNTCVSSRDLISAVDTASRLGTVPLSVPLTAGSIIAVVGDTDAFAVARAMVLQMAARSGPADWRLVVVSERRDEWAGLAWLPHLAGGDRCAGVCSSTALSDLLAGLDPSDHRHLLLVLDDAELLSARTSQLRRLLAGPGSIACVAVCPTEAVVPAICTSALVLGRGGSARWIADLRAGTLAETVQIAGISSARAFESAASIAGLSDPELADGSAVPSEVRLLDLLGADVGRDPATMANRIVARWSAQGADPPPSSPIGLAADGIVELDLRRDGPHALIAGTTGAGKSELLRSLVVGLAARCGPQHVTFVLVDYKGGSTFDACAALPHTVGVVTDLDDRLAGRALRCLDAELRRREVLLRAAGASDLAGYRAMETDGEQAPALPRLIVVIDEFAGLAVQQPDFIGALLGIAQRGRSLGVHLLLATQRPHGVISDDIRANTNARIALRVHDPADSTDVVGAAAAAYLPRSTPGRAVMRLGADELIDFQAATCTSPRRAPRSSPTRLDVCTFGSLAALSESTGVTSPATGAPDLDVLVEAIRGAARAVAVPAPHPVWLDPLSTGMQIDALPACALGAIPGCDPDGDPIVGVIDDPDQQIRRALTWPARSGHLLLVGAPGSGTTTALLELATTLGGPRAAQHRAELFVIDASGDPRWSAVAGAGYCGGVVRIDEGERLLRVLDHLCGVIDDQRASIRRSARRDDERSGIVVMIDGLTALRTELNQAEQWKQLDQLDRIIAEGLTAGVRVAVSADRPGAVPSAMLGQIARRWIFHLADPHDAGSLGLSPAVVPGPTPGRLFDTVIAAEAQVIVASPATAGHDHDPGHRHEQRGDRLRELSAEIAVSTLPAAASAGGDVLAPIGVAFDDLQPAVLPIACGEHVLVVGPARSGRTTVLNTIADRWTTAHRDGWVANIAARRSSSRPGSTHPDIASLFAEMPHDRPVLLVIDDAELVDDPTGVMSARVGNRCENITVVAAGRGDSMRAGYGHWTAAVRRSRLGLVMAAAGELDGDLLGATLPRRLPIPARPGLAWLIADGDRRLVQVAVAHSPLHFRSDRARSQLSSPGV